MVRPPLKVLTLPRLLRRNSAALLRDILSASSPVRLRRVVVTISERFGNAIVIAPLVKRIDKTHQPYGTAGVWVIILGENYNLHLIACRNQYNSYLIDLSIEQLHQEEIVLLKFVHRVSSLLRPDHV